MVDSAVIGAVATVITCLAGYAVRVILARISARSVLQRTQIEQEGRAARIRALGEGGTLQERDEVGNQLVVRQGALLGEGGPGAHAG